MFVFEYEIFVDWQTLVEIYNMQAIQEEKTPYRELIRDFLTVPIDGVEMKMSYKTASMLRDIVYPQLKGIMG